jgi:hypothetical protein
MSIDRSTTGMCHVIITVKYFERVYRFVWKSLCGQESIVQFVYIEAQSAVRIYKTTVSAYFNSLYHTGRSVIDRLLVVERKTSLPPSER